MLRWLYLAWLSTQKETKILQKKAIIFQLPLRDFGLLGARIVRLINKFPDAPNKDVGEGLNTAFGAMQKLRLKNPQIIESDNSVSVIIKHEKLASPEELVEIAQDNNFDLNDYKINTL